MAPIRLECPLCKRRLLVKRLTPNRYANCPACGNLITLPESAVCPQPALESEIRCADEPVAGAHRGGCRSTLRTGDHATGEHADVASRTTYVPARVGLAGLLWMIVGRAYLLDAIVATVLAIPLLDGARGFDDVAVFGVVFCVLILLRVGFGWAFIHVSRSTTRGDAKDTLGNGVASSIIGLLWMAFAILLVSAKAYIAGAFTASIATALIVAGSLALMGRKEYLSWKSFRSDKNIRTSAAMLRQLDTYTGQVDA